MGYAAITAVDYAILLTKGNADSLFEQLEKLNEFVKQEWVEQGNTAELYERIGPTILVILDNATYRKRQDVFNKS